MSSLCHRRETCRLCGGRRLESVLELAPTPPANAFVSASEIGKPQERFPLDVFLCSDCAHVQLLDVVDPRLLFENYVYVAGTSPVFVRHFEEYARDILRRFAPAAGSLVVDIGSNDGTLLGFFKAAGHRVLGIDPALKIAENATRAGIPTRPAFFTPALARELRAEAGGASVVTANNVFAHVDDLQGVVEGVKALLTRDGVFVFEVSYLVDVYEKTLFDTIYHEHVSYHSVKPLVRFFRANGMELIDAIRVSSHGGSLRGIAQLANGPWKVGGSVDEAVRHEEQIGLDRPVTYQKFGRDIDALKRQLGTLLRDLKKQGNRIAAFGAPAKATTLMFHFEIGPELISFIADDSPWKQGLYSPGYHIPVKPASAMEDERPNHVVILAWNFADSIMKNHRRYTDGGGRFIVPIPAVRIY